jgi:hypothetical protein
MSKQTKAMQKKILKLQKELAQEIKEIMSSYGSPMDMQTIMDNYPDNERKKSNDTKTLKQYISMGLGYMISTGMVKELPITTDGRYLLELT